MEQKVTKKPFCLKDIFGWVNLASFRASALKCYGLFVNGAIVKVAGKNFIALVCLWARILRQKVYYAFFVFATFIVVKILDYHLTIENILATAYSLLL